MNIRKSTCLLVTIPLLLLTLTASPVAAHQSYYAASFWFTAEGQYTMVFNPHMVDSVIPLGITLNKPSVVTPLWVELWLQTHFT